MQLPEVGPAIPGDRRFMMDLCETELTQGLQLLHEIVIAAAIVAAARYAPEPPLNEDHKGIVQCSFQKREGRMALGLEPLIQPQTAFLLLARRHLTLLLLVKVMIP